MEKVTLDKIAEMKLLGEEDKPEMLYLEAIEIAICSLSKSPLATYNLLNNIADAYDEICHAERKIGAEHSDDIPSPNEVVAAMVPVALEELHSVAPKLKAEDLTAAIFKGFQAAGLIERVRNTDDNLDDRADVGGNE